MAGAMLPPVIAVLAVNTAQFSAGMLKAKGEMATVADSSSSMSLRGKAAFAGFAAAAGAVAAESIHMAGNFEQSTNKLVTSAGETAQGLGVVRSGMLAMAGDVGVSALSLSDAMYKVESAGYHGAAGLGLLKAAEQGAKAEGADGVKVADALSSAMRDYYPHAQSAADVTKASTDVMSKFIGATSAGKMTFDELAGSLNSILPVSSAAKISLSDTLGVLASMTVHGISAEQATQNMADAIRHLQAPTAVMSKAMATLGIDSTDVASKLGERGLSGTMQMLSERVKAAMPPGSDKVILQLGDALSKSTPKVQELGQKLLDGSITMGQYSKEARAFDPLSAKQAASFSTLAGSYHQLGTQQISGAQVMQTYGGMMQKVMGDATGLKVALMTTGENAGYTSDAIKTITSSTADASGNVKGWSEVQGTFNQKMSQAKAALGALAIEIGTNLLPYASKIASVFADASHWLTQHGDVAKVLSNIIGGVLVAAIAAYTAKMVASVAKTTASFVADIAKGTWWVATKLAHFAAVTASAAVEGVATAAKWVASTAAMLADVVVSGAKWLAGMIANFVAASASAVAEAAVTAAAWIAANATMILATGGIILAVGLLVAAGFWLSHHWREVWAAIKGFATDAWHWLDGNVIHPIVEAFDWMGRKLDEFGSWWGRVWDDAVRWVESIPGRIAGIFGDAGRWLWNAGKAILDGLLSGLKAAWHGVTDFVGGIGDWIASHKGPIDYDRQLLVPHGNAIMAGLHDGLRQGGGRVADFLDQFTNSLAGTSVGAITGSLSMTGTASASPAGYTGAGLGGGGGAPSGVTVNVIVQGPLLSTKAEIKRAVQEAFLQNGMRNVQNGLSFTTT